MENLVKVNLFGDLGEYIQAKEWELNVKSAQEAISAINTLTQNKFNEYFIKKNKLNAKYRILINGNDFISTEKEINKENWEKVYESEIVMKKENLRTIDIVPVIESGDVKTAGILTIIVGVILIIIGMLTFYMGGGYLIMAGISLLAAGAYSLISRPPSFQYNADLSNAVSQSYLFNGPQNTVGEGNPIPIGYGTFLVGSNVVSAGYKITEFQTVNQNDNT